MKLLTVKTVVDSQNFKVEIDVLQQRYYSSSHVFTDFESTNLPKNLTEYFSFFYVDRSFRLRSKQTKNNATYFTNKAILQHFYFMHDHFMSIRKSFYSIAQDIFLGPRSNRDILQGTIPILRQHFLGPPTHPLCMHKYSTERQ